MLCLQCLQGIARDLAAAEVVAGVDNRVAERSVTRAGLHRAVADGRLVVPGRESALVADAMAEAAGRRRRGSSSRRSGGCGGRGRRVSSLARGAVAGAKVERLARAGGIVAAVKDGLSNVVVESLGLAERGKVRSEHDPGSSGTVQSHPLAPIQFLSKSNLILPERPHLVRRSGGQQGDSGNSRGSSSTYDSSCSLPRLSSMPCTSVEKWDEIWQTSGQVPIWHPHCAPPAHGHPDANLALVIDELNLALLDRRDGDHDARCRLAIDIGWECARGLVGCGRDRRRRRGRLACRRVVGGGRVRMTLEEALDLLLDPAALGRVMRGRRGALLVAGRAGRGREGSERVLGGEEEDHVGLPRGRSRSAVGQERRSTAQHSPA